jgi:hypothetical protein
MAAQASNSSPPGTSRDFNVDLFQASTISPTGPAEIISGERATGN